MAGVEGVSVVVASLVGGTVVLAAEGSGGSPAIEGVEPRLEIGALVKNCGNTWWVDAT